jgi:hypothetical protein
LSTFERKFDIAALKNWDGIHQGNAVRALFDRWALPGEQRSVNRSLRLCVRRGYLNFYNFRQSVAAVRMGLDGPRLDLHEKYALELAESSSVHRSQNGYICFGPQATAMPSTAEKVAGWIAASQTYASAEKRFIDDLVAANTGVIDLEMGLPSHDVGPGDRVAPRIDIVFIQASSHRLVELAFWEAKCSINNELRARSDIAKTETGWTGPGVVEQLDSYAGWINAAGHIQEVQTAYKETARLLVAFHQVFGRNYLKLPECVQLWQEMAEADPANISIAQKPGLVIGNYCPNGHTATDAAAFVRSAATFLSHGHRAKLSRHGITIHEVGPENARFSLPRLASV